LAKNQSHSITKIQFPIQLTTTTTIHQPLGLLLNELAFDPTNVRKHGLSYIVFSHIQTKEGLDLLTPFHQNFHIDQHVVEEINRLKNFANWTTFVPQLKNFYHGSNHAIKSHPCPIRPLHFHCFFKNILRIFLIHLSKNINFIFFKLILLC